MTSSPNVLLGQVIQLFVEIQFVLLTHLAKILDRVAELLQEPLLNLGFRSTTPFPDLYTDLLIADSVAKHAERVVVGDVGRVARTTCTPANRTDQFRG